MHTFRQSCQTNFPRLFTVGMIAGLVVLFASASDANAQRRKSALGDKKATDSKKDDPQSKRPVVTSPNSGLNQPNKQSENNEEFAPQVVTMEVKREGIQLVATWFPPIIEKDAKKKNKANPAGAKNEDTEPGKSVAPFILVHDWTRSRNDLLQLASFLQSQGHAVIVPDLRGHGQSLRVAGASKLMDYKRFKKTEKASATGDIDQCKRFLQEKNNEGLVNIDLLNVVAVGDSSHLAISWAIADWSWDPVAGIKQGKDVKSLILFSPSQRFAGSSLKKLAKVPLISGRNSTALPMFVIWGGQSEIAEDCDEFVELLRKNRPEAPAGVAVAMRWQVQSLFHLEVPTPMQGFQLAGNPRAGKIWSTANDFVEQKVLAFKDQAPWQIRGAEAVLKARDAQEKKKQ